MLAIADDEQPSYRAKSWLPKGLRRRRAGTSWQLLTDVRHRWRRCASSSLRRRSQRGPRDFCHGLPARHGPLTSLRAKTAKLTLLRSLPDLSVLRDMLDSPYD
jgi:hypothetical protein